MIAKVSQSLLIMNALYLVRVNSIATDNTHNQDSQMLHHRSLQSKYKLPVGVSECENPFLSAESAYRSTTTSEGHATVLDPKEKLPFCMNGGFCKVFSGMQNKDHPCVCVEGYAGPHCEFVGTEDDVPKTCTLPCENNSTCKIGSANWMDALDDEYHKRTPEEMQYCNCQAGFYGPLCEFSVTDNKNPFCGQSPCMNGGTCIKLVGNDGTASFNCDCTTAKADGFDYAGQFCEHKSTSQCFDDHNGKQFCVNGGTCKSDSHLGCNCPEGFVGPICEFTDLGLHSQECALKCFNQGICRKGAKDVSNLEKFGFSHHNRSLTVSISFSKDFEHCVCPLGFVGLQCEEELDVCPGKQHACFNGGDCVSKTNNGTVTFECDCSNSIKDQNRYAGTFCEMQATSYCTADGKMPLGGPSVNAFCTNGGVCKSLADVDESHPGCDCPVGYYGEHCEYLSPQGVPSTERSQGSKAVVTIFSLLGIGVIFLCIGFLLYRQRRKEMDDHCQNIISQKNLSPNTTLDEDDKNDRNDDNHSMTSSRASKSSKRSSHLKKSRRKKYSTMSRKEAIEGVGIIDATTTISANGDVTLIKKNAPWPNATKNVTDPANVLNEIDLGDDYGVNLVV